MRTIKLRGVAVDIDDDAKLLMIHIRKPIGKVFSLSDRVCAYANKGYTINAILPDRVIPITKDDEPFKEEEVKSKFNGAPSWYRYWFYMKGENDDTDR